MLGYLALLHLSIHSIFYKLDRFSNFLGSVALKFSIIGIYETLLDYSSHSSDISFFLILFIIIGLVGLLEVSAFILLII